MRKRAFFILCLAALLISATMLYANGAKDSTGTAQPAAATPAVEEKLVEYTVYFDTDVTLPWFDNSKDIVTKYVEDKFKLKVSEVFWRSGMMTDQRLNTFIATNSVPDVFIAPFSNMAPALPLAMDLTELVPKYMPYYWNNVLTEADRQKSYNNGQIKLVYKKDVHNVDAKGLANPYDNGYGLPMLLREDVLTKLGYKFTPMKEIQEKITKEGRAVTAKDLEITPNPYSNPAELMVFLRKIKALNLKDKAGNEVYPMSVRWGIQQIGSMFDFGTTFKWYSDKQEAHGYLGAPGAKEFLKWWWQAYQEGLIDPDYMIQKPAQLDEKVATGRAAITLDVGDFNAARKSLLSLDPTWDLRPIPVPMKDPANHGYYYAQPTGFLAVFINKNLDKDTAIRILKMWDWLCTDEGIDTLCYGPKEAGLYSVNAQGKKIFNEPLYGLMMQNTAKLPGGIEELGLVGLSAHSNKEGAYNSKIAWTSAAPKDVRGRSVSHSLPPTPDAYAQARRILSAPFNTNRADVAGAVGGVATTAANNYWNTTFKYNEFAKLLAVKTEKEFDDLWPWVMQRNEEEGKYSAAVKEMTAYFKNLGLK